MKITATILLAIALSGCSLIPTKFDSSLYDHLITLSVDIDQAIPLCGTPGMKDTVFALNRESKQALKYSQYASPDTTASIQLMDKAVSEMTDVYKAGTPSTSYCQFKLKILNDDLDAMLTTIGAKSK